jgi:hypothetical protein
MALDVGMGKKSFAVFTIIAVSLMVFWGGTIVNSAFTGINGDYEFTLHYNKLSIYTMNPDYGPPSFDGDIYYYKLELGSRFAGKVLNVDVTGKNCLVDGVFAYVRNPYGTGRMTTQEGNSSTVVRFTDTTFITHVPEDASAEHPWVIIAVIIPLGWYGDIPASSVFADISVVQVLGGTT